MNLYKIIEQAIQNGGISYSINNGDCNPSSGYMVSVLGCETKVDLINLDLVVRFIKHNIDLLSDSKSYLGIWLNDGVWYLDVSCNYETLGSAIIEGTKNKQLAIWDCENATEIKL